MKKSEEIKKLHEIIRAHETKDSRRIIMVELIPDDDKLCIMVTAPTTLSEKSFAALVGREMSSAWKFVCDYSDEMRAKEGKEPLEKMEVPEDSSVSAGEAK